MGLVNGKSVLAQEPDLIVETYTSMQRWRVVCKGSKQGPMVLDRAGASHNLPVAASSYVYSEDIYQDPGEHTYPPMYVKEPSPQQ